MVSKARTPGSILMQVGLSILIAITTGPRSFLSVCSKPAVKWVSEQTGRADFADIASHFASDITRRLKMDADISPTRAPEPDAETAWHYTEGMIAELWSILLLIVAWFACSIFHISSGCLTCRFASAVL